MNHLSTWAVKKLDIRLREQAVKLDCNEEVIIVAHIHLLSFLETENSIKHSNHSKLNLRRCHEENSGEC